MLLNGGNNAGKQGVFNYVFKLQSGVRFMMKIGIPLEVMIGEGRIALTPKDCKTLIAAGNKLYLQKNAGEESGYLDSDYSQYGVEIVETAQQLYSSAQLIVKVKQPLRQDLLYLGKQHILFSYLHLAADVSLIETLCDIGLMAIPFESVSDDNHTLPLLTPMSQVAGRISVLRGATLLFRNRGGRGVLLGGVDGTSVGRVVVLGAGIAGSHAAGVAVALGAKVDVVDLNEVKLQTLKDLYPAIETHISTPEVVEKLCVRADLVIGAVMLAGRRAPVVLPVSVIEKMPQGSVIIDIAIDQGGCVEGIRSTNSDELYYLSHGVLHSAVPNMPAAVARTASQSLSSAILPYVTALAASAPSTSAPGTSTRNEWQVSTDKLIQALYRATAIDQGKVVDDILKAELDSLP